MVRAAQSSTLSGARRFFVLFAWIAILSGLSIPVHALNPSRSLSKLIAMRWSGDDIPVRSLARVVYGSDGYIWMSSYTGLIRFDGMRFEVFNPPEGLGITTNGFAGLAPSVDGGLWLGGVGGGVFRFVDGEFSCVLRPEDSQSNSIGAVLESGSGSVWIAGNRGIGHITLEGDNWACRWPETLAELEVNGMVQDREGRVWAATDKGLWNINPEAGPIFHSALGARALSALALDADTRIWVSTSEGTVATVTMTAPWPVDHTPFNDLDVIRCLYFDRDGALWLGTNSSVHRLVDGTLERWSDATTGGATSFTEDAEGNLWFSSYYQGLVRLADSKFSVYSVDEGLPDETVHALAEANDGSMWVGTGQGLRRIVGDRVRPLPSPLAKLDSKVVLSLASGPDDELWIGAFDWGLAHWDGRELVHFGPNQGLSNLRIRRLYRDGDRLWIGTHKGLYLLRDGSIREYSRRDGLRNDFILAMHRDSSGRMWIGTDGGGLHLFEDDHFTAYTTDDGLPSMFVTDIHEDDEGALWLSTASGISRYRDGRFANAASHHGLKGRAFFQILEDAHGYFWLTGDEGISRVRKSELEALLDGQRENVKAVHFDRADGLRAVKMTGVAKALKAADGKLWFSTMTGVAVIDPSSIDFNEIPPPVHIESVLGDGVDLPMHGNSVEVPLGTGHLDIAYTGLSFVAPSKVRFRFRLVGFSDQWHDAGARRTAYFAGLAPGSYRFEVVACNNDGLWTDRPAVLGFVIKPRFHQTWAFYGMCGLGLFALGLGAAMVRIRALKNRQHLLATLVDERTQELADANRELAQMARVDGLTGIANHRRFEEFLNEEWRRLKRHDEPLSVVLIDVDHFKEFNDLYGHQEGDECLRMIAQVTQNAARRPSDLAARYGGEEFILVLSNVTQSEATTLAEKTRIDVIAAAVPHERSEHEVVSVSCGVATGFPCHGSEPAELVKRADNALYRAKRGGRNLVVVDEHNDEKTAE